MSFSISCDISVTLSDDILFLIMIMVMKVVIMKEPLLNDNNNGMVY